MQGFLTVFKAVKQLKLDAWGRIAWWVGLLIFAIFIGLSQSSDALGSNILTIGLGALTAFMVLSVPFAIGEITAKRTAFQQALFERHKYDLPIPLSWRGEVDDLKRVVFDPNIDMQIKIIVGWITAATFIAPNFLNPTLENAALVCLPIGANIWLYKVHFQYLAGSESNRLNFEAEREINENHQPKLPK